MPRYSTKPCPGCGEPEPRNRADQICWKCVAALKEHAAHVARVNTKKNLETVQIKGAWHWYPGFYFGGSFHDKELDQIRESLHKEFAELGELICDEILSWEDANPPEGSTPLFFKPNIRTKPTKEYPHGEHLDYPTSDGQGTGRDRYGKIDARKLELIRALWDHTARLAHLAYLGGVRAGRSLLVQLASGELSSDDLQEKDMRVAEAMQTARLLHEHIERPKKGKRK